MHIPRVYYAGELHIPMTLTLPETAGHHLSRVLRLRVGDRCVLFNGDGHEYWGQIQKLEKRDVILWLTEKQTPLSRESRLNIHLGQALTRSEKMDWIIQKAVELGVTEITPLLTQHCAVRYSEAQLEKKYAHWQAVLINACEQSGRTRIPHLHPLSFLATWLTDFTTPGIILDPTAKQSLFDLQSTFMPTNLRLLIGPEGGWHAQELTEASQAGFCSVKLGGRILRMETAALAAITAAQYAWGDFK